MQVEVVHDDVGNRILIVVLNRKKLEHKNVSMTMFDMHVRFEMFRIRGQNHVRSSYTACHCLCQIEMILISITASVYILQNDDKHYSISVNSGSYIITGRMEISNECKSANSSRNWYQKRYRTSNWY